MILFIDNYDSFTFNLVQAFALLKQHVKVFRSKSLAIEEYLHMSFSYLVIGPGPKTPKEAGISKALIKTFAGKVPILGICLGHQAIGEVFGAKIVKAPKPLHGKTCSIKHFNTGIFKNTPQNLLMSRYNSLVIEQNSIPDCLDVTAISNQDQQIMGIKHKTFAIEGVQFHPESILSEKGHLLLKNFLKKASF